MAAANASITPCIELNGKRLALILPLTFAILAVVLFVLDGFINYAHFSSYSQMRRMFNMAREDGLGTWLSVTQFFLIACTLWLISCRAKTKAESKWTARIWLLFAGFFAYLSVDDGAEVHERVGSIVKIMAKKQSAATDGGLLGTLYNAYPSYTWQLILGPVFGIIGILLAVFVWRQIKELKPRMWVIGGIGLYALAVGLDFLEGIEGLHQSMADYLEVRKYTVRHFAKITEEAIEIIGTSCLFYAFANHLVNTTKRITLYAQTPPR